MAFNLENMSVDYKSLLRLVPTQRMQVAQSGAINDLISALTPGQMINLFPRYYKEQLPDVGESSIRGAMTNAPGYRPSGGGGGTAQPYTPPPQLKTSLTPAQKSLQEIYEKAGLSQAPLELSGDKKEKAAALTERMMGDLGITREKAAAIVGNFMHESADFGTMQEVNPQSGRGGYGWAQWTGVRRTNFEKFVAERGLDINSDEANYQYFLHEIQNDAYERERFEAWKNTDYGSIAAETTAFEEAYERAGVKHHGSRIQRAETALQAYEQRVAAIESDVNAIKDLNVIQPQLDPTLLDKLDERYRKHYESANEGEKRRFEQALAKLGPEMFNEVMKKQPLNDATLTAVSVLGQSAGQYTLTEKLGDLTPQPRKYDPNRDDPGPSAPGEFNYSLSPAGIQALGIADEKGRVTPASVEKNLVEIQTNNGVKVKVHNSVAQNALGFLNELEKRGYPVRSADTGGYVYRSKSESPGLSTHATGTTLDVNWESNWGTFGKAGNIDFPPDVEKLANYYGFSWGAKFGDPMHFETMAPELHQQRLQELEAEGYIKRNDIQAEAEALRTADPVSAARANQEKLEQNTPPQKATGGTIIPGEDVAGVNLNTGKVEFMANSRERIRIDPAELENRQQMPTITREDTENLESSNQPTQMQRPRPTYAENPDPNLYVTMAEGQMSMPPSQVRATNRAKLYGETSSSMINGHFS